jgi:hypothetical protein
MKKMLLSMALCFAIGFVASAQKTPPTAVVSAFTKKFQDVKGLEWGKEKSGEWEAEFKKNGVEMSANFSADGKWLETETGVKFADLPAAVQTALKGKKVTEAAKIVRADGATIYEAEVKNQDLLFDANGKSVPGGKE